MLVLVEELGMNTVLPTLKGDGEIRLVFEYSEAAGGSVQMELSYAGEDNNPLESADALSLALIRHACEELEWRCDGGTCRIRGELLTAAP